MIEDLILKWRPQLDAVREANIWDTEGELAWLAETASKHTSILELGSFLGASTKIMALANPAAKIVVIDAWHDPGTREKFQELLDSEIKSGRVIAIHSNTSEGFRHLPCEFSPDFTFIDAGHLYDDVKNDISNVLSIQTTGIIAGHDYRHQNSQDGVNKAVHERFDYKVQFPADSIWSVTLCESQE